MTSLAGDIAAYKQSLPDLRERFGSVWALFVNEKLEATFDDFSEAALYAVNHFESEIFLIRHTDERQETIPFVIVDS